MEENKVQKIIRGKAGGDEEGSVEREEVGSWSEGKKMRELKEDR